MSAPDTAAPWRQRLRPRRPDPLTVVCFLVAAGVYALHGLHRMLDRDPSLYIYGGQRFADGVLPYVDVVNRAGPLAHVFPGLGVLGGRLIGVGDVEGVRGLFLLLSAGAVAATYALGRDVGRSRLVGLLAAGVLLTFEGISFYAAFGPREKTVMVLFTALALLASTRRRWLATGVWIALATLTWQPVFFAAALGALAAIVVAEPWRRWWRAALLVALGGAIPSLATVAVYAAAGRLQVLLDCFVVINARYTSQSGALSDLGGLWQHLVAGFGWSTWLFVVGLVAAVLLAVVALAPRSADHLERGGAAAVGVFTLGGVAWTLRAFDNWPDTMLLVPAAAVGAAGLVGLVLRRLDLRVAVTATGVLVALALALSVSYSLDHRDTTIAKEQAVADAALEAVPGATIVTIEAPQPLVLTRTHNLSRFLLYSNGMRRYIDATEPGGIHGMMRRLHDRHPDLVAIGRPKHPWSAELTQGYTKVSVLPQWSWWISDDVPAAQRTRLVAAIDDINRRYGSIAP